MRASSFVLIGLFFLGCNDSALQNDAAQDLPSAANCTGVWVANSLAGSWDPFCTTECSTSSDCALGERCAHLLGRTDRVCISATKPTRRADTPYDPTWHCDFFGSPSPTCDTDEVLRTTFSDKNNQTCGWVYEICAGGCVTPNSGADLGPAIGYCQ